MPASYYDLLNIKKNATVDEIKKAFKTMAIKYHPDKHRDKTQNEQNLMTEKFNEIRTAYETLVDPEKRKMYDLLGENYNKQGGFSDNFKQGVNFSSNFGSDFFSGFGGADFFSSGGDFFSNFSKGAKRQSQQHPVTNENFDLKVNLDEFYSGAKKVLKFDQKLINKKISQSILVEIKPGY